MSNIDMGEEFMKFLGHLLAGGYVLAKRNPRTGELEPLTPNMIPDGQLGRYEVSHRQLDDDVEVSLADSYRFGVVRAGSYASVRMKMMRSRDMYPDITPSFRTRGAHTLYRVGDLRKWAAEYDARSGAGSSRRVRRVDADEDALLTLLGKIRSEEE